MDGLAGSCALECALRARPRAGPGAMAAAPSSSGPGKA